MNINFTVNFHSLFHFYMLQKGWGNSMLMYFLQYYSYSLKDQQLKFQWIYAAIFCIPCLSSSVFLIWKKLILMYFILPTHNKISVRSFLYRLTAYYYVNRYEFSRHKYQTHSTHVLKDLKKHCLSFIACWHCKNVYFKLSLFEIVKNGCVNRNNVTGPKNNLQ